MKNKKTLILDNVVDLYVRVSTNEQAEEGYSVGEQEAKLKAYCTAMGYKIHNIHVDPGYSGATLDRPGIKMLIKDVQAGRVNKVIVWKLDRLSRSQKDTLILLEDVFLENNCNFVSLMESFDTSTPFGRCIVGILAAFAQMERENIRIRTAMGRQARIRKGHFHGTHPPLGYKFAPGCNDLVMDPYGAKMVREIFRRFIRGESINKISKQMDKTYGNNLYIWGHNTAVRRLLQNPVYVGKVTLGKEIYDGLHEPLISESDWNLAAAILEHNKAMDKRTYAYKASGNTADYLLTGLLFCGDCGARMYGRRVSKKTKKYICHSVSRTSPSMIKSDHCTNRLHPFTTGDLEGMVIDEIKKLALDRTYFESMVEGLSETQPDELQGYNERLEEVERQISRLLNLFQTGIIELDEIESRVAGLKDERDKIQSSMDALETSGPAMTLEAAWETITSFASVMESGDGDEIHRIIHSLVDKVVVLNNDVTIYWAFC